jgi:hypothetical protein
MMPFLEFRTMEQKFNVAWEGPVCVFTIKGRIGKEEIRRLALRQAGIEQGTHPESMIVNLLEADYSDISPRDISLVIAHTFTDATENPDMKLAIVATDPHVVRMCEYYLSTMSKLDMAWEVRIFRAMAEAREWIQA